MAAVSGSVEVVQMLIKHGVNADVDDDKGETPLHRAASASAIAIALAHPHGP